MIEKVNSNSFHSFDIVKVILTFCLLFSVISKPIVSVTSHCFDLEYELCENFEKTDSEEKEENTDAEEEDKIQNTRISDLDAQLIINCYQFAQLADLISSFLDVPFPPPDWC